MPYPDLNDQRLKEFQEMPKRVEKPGTRWVEKPGHKQRNFKAVGTLGDGKEVIFQIYQRQNARLPERDFSCGILLVFPGINLTLARYNSGHPDHIRGRMNCHIHQTCEQALRSGGRPERYAETTDRYTTLDGALYCLVQDFRIKGLPTAPEPPKLPLEWDNGS